MLVHWHAFPLHANARQIHTVLTKDAQKKFKESLTVSGTPKKLMEVPRTLEYKTLGKSLPNYVAYMYCI